jgi:hypothetical protein
VVGEVEVQPPSKNRHLVLGAGKKQSIERKNECAAYPNPPPRPDAEPSRAIKRCRIGRHQTSTPQG